MGVQNGGQGQNSSPLPVPLTLIQIHTNILPPLLSLHNWLQAFGIHHISWNPICKQRTAAAEEQPSLFLTRRYSPLYVKPGGRASRQSILTVLYPTLSWNMLEVTLLFVCWNMYKSVSLREIHDTWKQDKRMEKTGDFFCISFWWDSSESERKKKIIKDRHNTRATKREKQERTIALCSFHCQIIFTPQLSALTGWWTVEVILPGCKNRLLIIPTQRQLEYQ